MTPESHIGRSWVGHPLEDDCPCGKAACGLVDATKIDPACPQHALDAAQTMRQSHAAADCVEALASAENLLLGKPTA